LSYAGSAAKRSNPNAADSDFDVRSDVTYLTWLSPTTFVLKERRTLEINAPGLPEKLGRYGRPETEFRTTRRRRRQSAGAALRQFFRRSHLPSGAGTRLSHPRYEARYVRVTDRA
jgi:hypothetical protein